MKKPKDNCSHYHGITGRSHFKGSNTEVKSMAELELTRISEFKGKFFPYRAKLWSDEYYTNDFHGTLGDVNLVCITIQLSPKVV